MLLVAALVALPLPLVGLGEGAIPVARFLQLTAALVRLISLEGTGGMVVGFAALFAAHAVVYGVALALAARVLARHLLPRIASRLRDHLVVIATTLLVSLGVYAELYTTPYHHSSAHARLLELYR